MYVAIKKEIEMISHRSVWLLLSQVVNLQHSEVQDRVMLTGRHMVRDVSCKNCNSKLGWMYEFATEESQRYKEGRIILERALVRESEGFEHVPSDNSWVPVCCWCSVCAFPLMVWAVFHLWLEQWQMSVLCTIFISWTVDIFLKHLCVMDHYDDSPLSTYFKLPADSACSWQTVMFAKCWFEWGISSFFRLFCKCLNSHLLNMWLPMSKTFSFLLFRDALLEVIAINNKVAFAVPRIKVCYQEGNRKREPMLALLQYNQVTFVGFGNSRV